MVFLDSDYAGDAETTRISITGFCVFLMGVPNGKVKLRGA